MGPGNLTTHELLRADARASELLRATRLVLPTTAGICHPDLPGGPARASKANHSPRFQTANILVSSSL